MRSAAGRKLQEVEGQLRELRTLRDAMRRVIEEWDVALNGAGNDTALHLLDRLPDVGKRQVRRKRKGTWS